MEKDKNWQQCNMQTFWGEVAACSHVVQIYENEDALLNLLEGFVTGGLTVGDSVVIIATPAHLFLLEQKLRLHGLNVDALCATGQYLSLNAEEVLAEFMVNDWPDYGLFMTTIDEVFSRIRKSPGQVRVFGEMVALLWARGNSSATVMLEHLWNTYCEKETFSLFCAYPQEGFPQDTTTSLRTICNAHSKMVTGWGKSSTAQR
ncbi:MAG: hypothetical protein JWQ14_1011 [Adhaeribacter sp.]|jgi:hypothetical protein|nr:hypothetical protein [Adhaeribacter sp.]